MSALAPVPNSSTTFQASNGIRLLVPGGWPDSRDAERIAMEPDLLIKARAEAATAGHDVGLSAQQRTASPSNVMEMPGRRGRVRFSSAGAMLRQPAPVEWLVRDLLERDSVALLVGAPAAGKSFLAFDIACSIASGRAWNGKRVRQGAVFIVAGEGHHGIRRRLLAWQIARGTELRDMPLFITERAIALTEHGTPDDLAEAIQSLADLHEIEPAMIVVDTVARAFRGDENSATDMGQFLAATDEIRSHWRASMLLVHHTGHGADDRARGSSALRGAVDWEYLAKRDGDHLTLTCSKAKDAPPFAPMHFAFRQVALPWRNDDGEAQTSAVLDATEPPDDSAETARKGMGQRQQRALDALVDLYRRQGDTLERAGHPRDQGVVLISDWRDACAEFLPDRRDFDRVKSSLAKRSEIRLEVPHVRLP